MPLRNNWAQIIN